MGSGGFQWLNGALAGLFIELLFWQQLPPVQVELAKGDRVSFPVLESFPDDWLLVIVNGKGKAVDVAKHVSVGLFLLPLWGIPIAGEIGSMGDLTMQSCLSARLVPGLELGQTSPGSSSPGPWL